MSWIVFQKSAAYRYNDLGTYHWYRVGDLLTYLLYRGKVVNFATNLTGIPRCFEGKKIKKIEQLRKIYGELFDKMRARAASEDFPILEKALSLYPINEGICLGASLNFISRYLKEDTKDRFEAIKKISKQFSKKGTPEAQITQILYSAQDTKKLKKEKNEAIGRLGKELENELQETQKKLKERQKQVKALKSPAEIAVLIHKSRLKVVNSFNELKSKYDHKLHEIDAKRDFNELQPLGRLSDLKLKLSSSLRYTAEEQKTLPAYLKTRLSKLPVGAYLTTLRRKDSQVNHAIAFVKTSSENCYLFDPNLATLKYENTAEFASEFWKLTKNFYTRKGVCNIAIYNCSQQA